MGTGAHDDATTASKVAVADAGNAVDQTGGRKVRRRHDLDQFLDVDGRVFQHGHAGIDHFAEVVRWNVGRHADGDTRAAVDQQVGNPGWQDQRFLLGTIVVGAEIDRFLVQVGQQFVADARHAHFRVTHGRRVVAVHRTEVALTVDQHVAQRKILRHAHDGVVHSGIAVRVILTDDVADNTCRLLVGLVPVVGKLVHGEQDAPVHRLEAVAHIGQSPANDHAHRVIEVGVAHLLFQADR